MSFSQSVSHAGTVESAMVISCFFRPPDSVIGKSIFITFAFTDVLLYVGWSCRSLRDIEGCISSAEEVFTTLNFLGDLDTLVMGFRSTSKSSESWARLILQCSKAIAESNEKH